MATLRTTPPQCSEVQMLVAEEYANHSRKLQLPPQLPEPSQTDEQTLPRVLCVLSSVLEKLVARNDSIIDSLNANQKLQGQSLNAFQGIRAPSISIPKYLERIYKYTSCSPSCFVVGYVYIDRLLHKHPHSLVMSLNIHRLLLTSSMVASKILDDVHYNNAFYARVGGVSNAELNKLELELLFLLDYRVGVSSGVFESYCFHLEKEMLINGTGLKIEKSITPISTTSSSSVHEHAATETSTENMQNQSSSPHL